MTTATFDTEPSAPPSSRPATRSRIGLVVVASMVSGLAAAVAAVVAPILPAEETVLTGGVLCGLALGWALLAVLSVRLTDQPQRWAAAPAAFLAMAGLVAFSGFGALQAVFAWVWPPMLLGLAVWMVRRVHRQLPRAAGRHLLYPLIAALAMASVGGGYETVRESLDAQAYPPPGQLVDVGAHRLHLQCTGSGAPTVILEPGLGAGSVDLGLIAPAVARDSRVCVYDRAGRGWSEAANQPQDGAHVAADLHTLLERAHVPGPYVLAGHSFGGLYVQSFAAQFPADVAGLVLLDSTAPKPGPAAPADRRSRSVVTRTAAVLPALAHLGVARALASGSYASLPPRIRDAARANAATARSVAALLEELQEGDASMHEASSLTGLGGKPLLVLTADTGHDATWRSAQEHLATLSTNGIHRYAHATHESMLNDPYDSAAVNRAVRDVVVAVRTGAPLA